jgi:hypothetical protein
MAAPVVSVRGSKAIVRWIAAGANGSTVSTYTIDISRGRDRSVAGAARKVIFKNLAPGLYRFRVAATNAVGTSPFSARARVRVR